MKENNKKHIVTNWLVDSGVIKKEETELYDYAITTLIFIKRFDLAKCIMSGVTLASMMMLIGSLVNTIKTRRINHEKT